MSNQLVPISPAMQQMAMPASIQHRLQAMGYNVQDSALSQGVGVQFANVSYKGKVFRIKYGGQETMIVDPQTNQPLQYFDVILVDAKKELSKTYYQNGYQEGSNEAPDCSSEDGIHPVAPAGKQPQAVDCRTCPWNAFGSKRSNDGVSTNSKACADTRKVVVVPAVNIQNENFGGPMLLRIPAASLTGLAQFDRTLSAQGVPFFAAIVRVTFDYTVAYPKLQFQAMRFLSDQEFAEVLALRNDSRTRDILNQGNLQAPQNTGALPAAAPAPAPAPIQGQPPQGIAQNVAAAQPAAGYAPVPAPAPAPNTVSFAPPPPVQQPPVAALAATIPQQPSQQPPVTSFAPPPPVQAAPPMAAPPMQPPGQAQAQPTYATVAPPATGAPTAQLPQEVLNQVDGMFA